MEKLEKTTFRLPAWELARLREQSRRQKRSLNSVASDVIARGLTRLEGSPEQTDAAVALGSLLLRPAQRAYHPPGEAPADAGLSEALEWSRGER